MQLQGKSAIVTGAASGIGAAIARAFAAEGAAVCVADIDGAERIAAELGRGAIAVRMDVTDEAEVESGIADAARRLNGIDILVSNAGVQHLDTIADVSFSNWKRVLGIHLDGGFLTTRACLRRMIAQKRGGAVILMGSVHSKEASVQKRDPMSWPSTACSASRACWQRRARWPGSRCSSPRSPPTRSLASRSW